MAALSVNAGMEESLAPNIDASTTISTIEDDSDDGLMEIPYFIVQVAVMAVMLEQAQ